jgi:hypothetical protein
MATDARTWFYSVPEPRPFFIEERVNQTLWRNRLQDLYMSCTQPTIPIKMEGRYHGQPVRFEWQPGKYFILSSGEENKQLAGVIRQVLMFPPSFSYHDDNGMYVVEWRVDPADADDRWHHIQNNPQFRTARRVKRR